MNSKLAIHISLFIDFKHFFELIIIDNRKVSEALYEFKAY